MMKVRQFQDEDFSSMFAYWQKLGKRIPYFFPVTPTKWHECMFTDTLDNKEMFSFLETFVAEESDQIIGFVQYGQPDFAWDKDGNKYRDAHIGNIRHFYFDADQLDAADLLYAQCESFMKQFPHQHAFYHIFGMSCNAYHGKLHESLVHVNQFLREKGYQVEHENQYYNLELKAGEISDKDELHLVPKPSFRPIPENIYICLREKQIGEMQIRNLDKLTGGATKEIAYLTWMWIDGTYRRQGWGRKAMNRLTSNLHSLGYGQLHLDTASTNEGAQRFFEQYGFENRGRTRSFIKEIR